MGSERGQPKVRSISVYVIRTPECRPNASKSLMNIATR